MSRRPEDTAEHLADVDTWAERIAATLPPLTGPEAEAAGRLAAVLDARASRPQQAEARAA